MNLNFFFGALVLVFSLIIGKNVNTYLQNNEVKELQEFGIESVAKIVSINSVKRGFEIDYEYYINGRRIKAGELVSNFPMNIKVGDYYSIVYSKNNYLTRRVDFSNKKNGFAEFENEERNEIKLSCNCTSGKVISKEIKGKTILLKYDVNTNNGIYRRIVEVNRAFDYNSVFKDSFFLVLISTRDNHVQRIFLNIPRNGMSLDSFPTEANCKNAINDLSKSQGSRKLIF